MLSVHSGTEVDSRITVCHTQSLDYKKLYDTKDVPAYFPVLQNFT